MQIEEEASLFEITRTQALSTSPTSCALHANLFQFKKNGRRLAIVQFSSAIFILQDQGAYGLLGNGAIEFLLPSGVQRGKFSIEEDCAIEWWQISWTPNVTLLHNYILTISATRNFANISWKKWHPLGISISFTIAPSIFTINLHQEFSCLSSTEHPKIFMHKLKMTFCTQKCRRNVGSQLWRLQEAIHGRGAERRIEEQRLARLKLLNPKGPRVDRLMFLRGLCLVSC